MTVVFYHIKRRLRKVKRKPKVDFEVGDTVRAMEQSHGWGVISKGDAGTVAKVSKDGLEVDFQNQKNWFGRFRCFTLVKKNKQGVVRNDKV